MLTFEKRAKDKGFSLVIGIDEAGRGPLAGPVVASAVALKTHQFDHKIRDSKKISHSQREKAFLEIYQKAYVGVGIVNEKIIDDINILNATYMAMNFAVDRLLGQLSGEFIKEQKPFLLIDGRSFKSDLPYQWEAIVGGDSSSMSIACASIVAKVSRDRILYAYDKVFPKYGFSKHKGYPTKAHRQAIKEHGLSVIHRRTFHSGI